MIHIPYNSPIYLKYTITLSLVYLQSCASVTTVNFRTFSSSPKETPHHSEVTAPHSLPSPQHQSYATTDLRSVCVDLPILDILRKWNRTICGLL